MESEFVSPSVTHSDLAWIDAAERGHFEALHDPARRASDVNAAQADGMTALHWAAYHGNAAAANALLVAGARVDARNRYGVRPLELACQNGDDAIIELLLTAGADANAPATNGASPLMLASRVGKRRAVETLLARGADVHARERSQQTALMWAAAEGHAEIVRILLAAGADANAQLSSGFTPLMFAVRGGHEAATLALLDAGCNVNQVLNTQQGFRFGRDKLQLTPLLLAIENGHFELAETLLSAGADANASPGGFTALHAVSWVRKPIRGDGDPPPQGSGRRGSLDAVRMLVEAGAQLDAPLRRGKSELGRFTYTGSTPFLLAAQASDVPLMQLLVELGADPHVPNADGTTALLAATGVGALGDGDETAGEESEALAAVGYLIDLGLDVNAIDQNGESALHGAAYQSRAELVKLLVAREADPHVWNHENRAGWTPLAIARGYRPGNFRPDPATVTALEEALAAASLVPPSSPAPVEHRRVWHAQRNEEAIWVVRDLEYAAPGGEILRLDLHMPKRVASSPLIVWVHGGAWRSGSKADMPLGGLVKRGYTVASVDYRLSTTAQFPAQIHDLKAAIRRLRKLSQRYGYRADRIAIAGASAGGHLATLVGTTNGNRELEGTLGTDVEETSAVQAIVSFYGMSNLATILSQSTPHGLGVRVPALRLLLGGLPDEVPDLARLASPVEHVDGGDPPLLMFHGDQDPQAPINQSHELHGRYVNAQLEAEFEVLHGAGHGGADFYSEAILLHVDEFLRRHLQTH
ncbi:MAG: ankyrin repeat domain-containing protein [Planctomycetales bacterium]|nr:ankyrin repeat domain-containing protein [Planctomycetales bacterium]